MPADLDRTDRVPYRRARFATRLPSRYLYTPAHFWIDRRAEGTCRVGFTRFATRMLGEVVEFAFTAGEGEEIEAGQVIGWLEGFKAMTDLYSVMSGRFAGVNPLVQADPDRVDADPYGDGWLYLVRGEPDPAALDVHGYIGLLDETIDRMLAGQQGGEK